MAIWYLFFCDWLISLSRMSSRFTYHISKPSSFLKLKKSALYISHISKLYSSVSGHGLLLLFGFYKWHCYECACTNVLCHVASLSVLWGTCPGAELKDHMVFKYFWENILFSTSSFIKPQAMNHWSNACREPRAQQETIRGRFICMYSHSPSFELLPDLYLLSDQQQH